MNADRMLLPAQFLDTGFFTQQQHDQFVEHGCNYIDVDGVREFNCVVIVPLTQGIMHLARTLRCAISASTLRCSPLRASSRRSSPSTRTRTTCIPSGRPPVLLYFRYRCIALGCINIAPLLNAVIRSLSLPTLLWQMPRYINFSIYFSDIQYNNKYNNKICSTMLCLTVKCL